MNVIEKITSDWTLIILAIVNLGLCAANIALGWYNLATFNAVVVILMMISLIMKGWKE